MGVALAPLNTRRKVLTINFQNFSGSSKHFFFKFWLDYSEKKTRIMCKQNFPQFLFPSYECANLIILGGRMKKISMDPSLYPLIETQKMTGT